MNERAETFRLYRNDYFTEDLLEITDDETLYSIQNALPANPLLGDVIKGTGGARKGRIGNPKNKSGKSGGFRFVYIYLPNNDRFYLLTIYSKKDYGDLSPGQAKMLGAIVREVKKLDGEK